MTQKLAQLFAATICMTVATSAHAVPEKAKGTLIAQGASVGAGNLAEGEKVRATYFDSSGFHVYSDGVTRKLADTTTSLSNWIGEDGSVWLFDGALRHASPGSSLRTVSEVGGDCPGAGTVTAFDGVVYDSPSSLIVGISCRTETPLEVRLGVYRVDSDGGGTKYLGWLTPVPGFPTANEPAAVSQISNWTRSAPNQITFTAFVFCEGDPDCPPYTGVTEASYRTTGVGNATLVWRPGMVLPGTPPEYAEAHLGGSYRGGRGNDKGDLVYSSVGSYNSEPPLGWFVLANGGNTRKVVALKDQPSGALDPFVEIPRIEIDGTGRLVFTTKYDTEPVTLWQETQDAQRRILHPGSVVAGLPGDEVASIKDWRVSPTGRLAIIANMETGTYGREVLLATDADGELEVIWSGKAGGGGTVPIETPTGEIEVGGRMVFGGNFGPTTGVDGYGSVFTSNDRFQILFVPAAGDNYLVAFDLEPAKPAGPEVLLEFELDQPLPIRWGDELSFKATILNASDQPIRRVALDLGTDIYMEFYPERSSCPKGSTTNAYDASLACAYDVEVPAFGETTFRATTRTITEAQDKSFNLTGTLTTTHADGSQGSKETTSKFTLLAGPQTADLRLEVHDGTGEREAVTVHNDGPEEAQNVLLELTISDGNSVLGSYDGEDDCEVVPNHARATCNFALALGESRTVPVPSGSSGTAEVYVYSDQNDPDPSNNGATILLIFGGAAEEEGCAIGGRPGARWLAVTLLLLFPFRRRRRQRPDLAAVPPL